MPITWLAIEPVQILQTIKVDQAAPLRIVAERPFLVRAYPKFSSNRQTTAYLTILVLKGHNIESRIVDFKSSIPASMVEHLREVEGKAATGDDYRDYVRSSLDRSFNWIIHPEQFEPGVDSLDEKQDYKLVFLIEETPGSLTRTQQTQHAASHAAVTNQDYKIRRGTDLRVHMIGLRYYDRDDEDGFVVPSSTQFYSARDYAERALPVASLSHTDLCIDAPDDFQPPFTTGVDGTDYVLQERINAAHAISSAVRMIDIDTNKKNNSYYYAIVDRRDWPFEGAASDAPGEPHYNSVAVGPADIDNAHYCAHEIGHLLGLTHRGGSEQLAENFHDWSTRPLRSSDKRRQDILLSMGIDVTDPRLLSYKTHVDLMSYGQNIWPSYETTEKIRKKLEQLADNEVKVPIPHLTRYIYVCGTYNLHLGRAEIRYVLPLKSNCGLSGTTGFNFPSKLYVGDADVVPDTICRLKLEQDLVLMIPRTDGRVIYVSNLQVRRPGLDFPTETGMFQAFIDRNELQDKGGFPPDVKKLMLFAAKVTEVVTASPLPVPDPPPRRLVPKVLYSTEIKILLDYPPAGRIRPGEIDVQRYDEDGFVLRIDKQLSSAHLSDANLEFQVKGFDRDDWHTIAVSARTGHEVYLDGRVPNTLGLMKDGEYRKALQKRDNNEPPLSDLELSTKRQTLLVRLRINATLGLDKVIVFEGVIAESAVRDDRHLVLSIDLSRRYQPFAETDNFKTHNTREFNLEQRDVEFFLKQSLGIFLTIEPENDISIATDRMKQIWKVVTTVAKKFNLKVPSAHSTSGQLKFEEVEGNREATIYFAYH